MAGTARHDADAATPQVTRLGSGQSDVETRVRRRPLHALVTLRVDVDSPECFGSLGNTLECAQPRCDWHALQLAYIHRPQ